MRWAHIVQPRFVRLTQLSFYDELQISHRQGT
jgi:hypothetical protein